MYLKNIYTFFTKHNSILRSIHINITQLIISFRKSAWSFVILIPLHSLTSTIQYLAKNLRDCDYVNNPLSPIVSQPHSSNVCYVFFSLHFEQFIQSGFCVFLQTIKLLPWYFLEIKHEDYGLCQQIEKETS